MLKRVCQPSPATPPARPSTLIRRRNQCGRAIECQGQVEESHTDHSKGYRGQQAELAEQLGFDAELAAAGVHARLPPIFLPVASRRLADTQTCSLFVHRHTVTP